MARDSQEVAAASGWHVNSAGKSWTLKLRDGAKTLRQGIFSAIRVNFVRTFHLALINRPGKCNSVYIRGRNIRNVRIFWRHFTKASMRELLGRNNILLEL